MEKKGGGGKIWGVQVEDGLYQAHVIHPRTITDLILNKLQRNTPLTHMVLKYSNVTNKTK